jgi:hypothetical protein
MKTKAGPPVLTFSNLAWQKTMNNSEIAIKQRYRLLIDSLLEHKITCAEGNFTVIELGKAYAALGLKDQFLDRVFEAIIHFCSDEDIRAQNQKYAAEQVQILRQYRDQLAQNL